MPTGFRLISIDDLVDVLLKLEHNRWSCLRDYQNGWIDVFSSEAEIDAYYDHSAKPLEIELAWKMHEQGLDGDIAKSFALTG